MNKSIEMNWTFLRQTRSIERVVLVCWCLGWSLNFFISHHTDSSKKENHGSKRNANLQENDIEQINLCIYTHMIDGEKGWLVYASLLLRTTKLALSCSVSLLWGSYCCGWAAEGAPKESGTSIILQSLFVQWTNFYGLVLLEEVPFEPAHLTSLVRCLPWFQTSDWRIRAVHPRNDGIERSVSHWTVSITIDNVPPGLADRALRNRTVLILSDERVMRFRNRFIIGWNGPGTEGVPCNLKHHSRIIRQFSWNGL